MATAQRRARVAREALAALADGPVLPPGAYPVRIRDLRKGESDYVLTVTEGPYKGVKITKQEYLKPRYASGVRGDRVLYVDDEGHG